MKSRYFLGGEHSGVDVPSVVSVGEGLAIRAHAEAAIRHWPCKRSLGARTVSLSENHNCSTVTVKAATTRDFPALRSENMFSCEPACLLLKMLTLWTAS